MHIIMKQIAIKMAMLGLFLHVPRIFWGGRPGVGMRNDVTALPLYGFKISAWNLVAGCIVPWSILLFEIAMLSQFMRVPWKFELFHDRLGPKGLLILGNVRKLHYRPKVGGIMQCTKRTTISNGLAQTMFSERLVVFVIMGKAPLITWFNCD